MVSELTTNQDKATAVVDLYGLLKDKPNEIAKAETLGERLAGAGVQYAGKADHSKTLAPTSIQAAKDREIELKK